MKVHVVSYATPTYVPYQRIASVTARRAGADSVRALGRADLDPSFVARHREVFDVGTGGGYWLWKPWVLAGALADVDDGDVVAYLDAGVHFTGSMEPVLSLLDRSGDLLLLDEGFREAEYTKRDAFVLLDCDGPEWWDTPQRFASVVVARASPSTRGLVADWLHACEDRRVLTDAPNEAGQPNLPGFIAHRHDQSALSLLSKRAGVAVPENRLLREGLTRGDHVLNHTRAATPPAVVARHLEEVGWLTSEEARSLGPVAGGADGGRQAPTRRRAGAHPTRGRVFGRRRGRRGRVQLYSTFDRTWSIAHVSTEVARELGRRGLSVSAHSLNGEGFFDPATASCEGIDVSAPVGIHWGFPDEVPDHFHDAHTFGIGGFTCETDRIPEDWVASCNRFDLVVVPSTYCRWAFLESGVSVPVMVVPHGVGSAFRPRHELVRRTPLIFYNTFHATSVFERKGVDELVSAFLEAFGRDGRDAVLRLRTQVTREMFDLAGRHDFGEAITVMPLEDLDVDSYAALFGLVHCTVHPSRGEGFGLVPLQSIACGTPVIATGATGMDDYLSDSNAIRVRTAGRVAGHSVGNAAGAYHRIDQDHLVGSLQEMHTNWEHHYARTRRAAVGVRERYAWPAVLDSLARVVGEAAGRGDRSGLRRDLAERWGAP